MSYNQQIILAPFNYIKSLPSKGVRDILIDSLNVWFQLPERSLQIIKKVVDLLHTSSLLFVFMRPISTIETERMKLR